MSMVMTSGFSDSAIATASRPSLALPTTCSWSSALKIPSRTFRINAESSTTSTRNFLLMVAMVCLRYRHDGARRFRSYKLFDRRDQLILLDRLGQECSGAFLHRAIAMLCPRARRNDHHGNAPRGRALAQLHHQFVTCHAWHFEVGDNQMAAVLRHQFGRFQSVRRQFHPVTVLLKHSADEFAHADRVVRHHDYALLLDAVDGLGWNASARNRRRARRKYSRGAGASLYRPALARFCCHHAVQIDQQYKAAIGRNRRTREEFYPAKVFAQVLDNDFVLAENVFHDEANLPVSSICDHHPEVTIDRFERRQPQIGIQTHDLCDHVAYLGQKFSADVFDFIGAQAADFLDDRQRQREIRRAAAHKQSRRDNQGERHLEGKLRALAARALDIDFAVQRVQVCPHHIKSDSTSSQFRFHGSR